MTDIPELAALTFFNERQALTVDALSARIIPGDEDDPGAREARAVVYIDRALAGAYREHQPLYQRGLRALDEHCAGLHGRPFAELRDDEQDAVLAGFDDVVQAAPTEHRGSAPSQGELAPPEALDFLAFFFAVVREHVIEGTFCDPVHGGNHDLVGWRLVGFPGAQWGYDDAQRALGFDARQIPMQTLGDLQRRHGHAARASR